MKSLQNKDSFDGVIRENLGQIALRKTSKGLNLSRSTTLLVSLSSEGADSGVRFD
jgi:hypothetical protein